MEIFLVYMTAGNIEEARRIGRDLVESRLAACVNMIDGMHSIYRWAGELQQDTETVLIAKTTADRVSALVARVRASHSYECPCIVTLPISGGNPDFLKWIADETRDAPVT